MNRSITCVSRLGALLCLLPLARETHADDWPGFRGPTGDGIATTSPLPLTWSASQHVAWVADVPGRAYSSPVILGDRIWLTTATETKVRKYTQGSDSMQQAERVSLGAACLDRATGKQRWRAELFPLEQPEGVHEMNSYATPTPAVEPGRLYCDFGTFGTAALDAGTGRILWQKRVPLDHQVGPGSSVLLYKDLLVLVRDGRDQQYVCALDTRTGDERWKTARPPIEASSPNLKKSFSSPLLIRVGEREQVVVVGPQWVASYEPGTGREIWRARHGKGFSIGTCPVYGGGMVYFGTGCFRAEMCAVKADGTGDVTSTHFAWRSDHQVPVMSSPVLAGGDLYWVSDGGVISCADAATGTIRWKKSLGRPHLASPLFADGRLYFFDTKGRTTVIKPGPQFDLLAENELEGHVAASPAAVGAALYLRTDDRLYCIRQSARGAPGQAADE